MERERHVVIDDLARSRSVRTSITTAGYYSTVTGAVHLKVDGANNEERFRLIVRSIDLLPSFFVCFFLSFVPPFVPSLFLSACRLIWDHFRFICRSSPLSNNKLGGGGGGGGGGVYLQPSPEQVRKPLMEPEPDGGVDSNGDASSASVVAAAAAAAALHERTRSKTPSPNFGGGGGGGGARCSVIVEMRQLNGVSPPPMTPPPPPTAPAPAAVS